MWGTLLLYHRSRYISGAQLARASAVGNDILLAIFTVTVLFCSERTVHTVGLNAPPDVTTTIPLFVDESPHVHARLDADPKWIANESTD